MANDAALVAKMEVRLATFERQMKKAGVIAGDAVQDVEGRFARANPSISAAVFKGLLSAQVFNEAFRMLGEFKARLDAIGEAAKLTGLSVNEVFALQEVGSSFDIKPEVITKGLESLGEKLNEAKSKTNDLAELFEANGERIKDAAGNVVPLQSALQIVANLVQNASSEFDKIEIARLAGLSREWVQALEQGGPALAAAQTAARNVAPDVQVLIDKAQDFDKAWKEVSAAVGNALKGAFTGAYEGLKKFFDLLAKRLDESGATAVFERHVDRINAEAGVTAKADEAVAPSSDTSGLPIIKVRSRPTVIPSKSSSGSSGGGGGGSSADPERYFQDEMRRMRERAQQLEVETRLIGKSTEEREKALATLELEQALQRGGVPISDEHRRKIEEQAAAYAKVTDASERAREQQRQNQELQQFVGREMVSVFSDLITGAATFEDAMKRLSRTILDAALNALLLGQGPLAGLFGTAGAGGNVGGLVGALFGGGRASGGPVQSGKTYVVGENGPELVRFGRNGSIVPNGLVRGEGGGGGMVNVTLVNQSSQPVGAASTRRRGNDVELIIRDLEDGVAGRAARGRGSLAPALSGPAYRRG